MKVVAVADSTFAAATEHASSIREKQCHAGDLMGHVKAGLNLRFREFSRALKRRVDLVGDLQRRFEDYDFIVSPVAAGPTFLHNQKHRPIELEGRTLG